ncbi:MULTISPECIES: helix-turn-helix domain-containing protein [unclassified Chitinophaga]|uniref:winged helix-turn-helix transcriptional regulator n=1 Tax=unclassified Chitinophaga TaxID=2619133 RepID=UPI0009D2AFE6|nr:MULTISPECIES: helix-turn-helix domain-containing protein [unclassified Chitinophaga]OMP79159.1 transcriptional regulator [[Flexibacter] sp. ATCC 35208]WPV68018.1 helix-turn-helix domain-containing protein [Chitinophaga sp. LS1]
MKKFKEHTSTCPIVHTMTYIGGKWKPIILGRLVNGAVRFGKLAVQIPDISRKILTEQLKELENDGLILRHSYNEKPPRVEYELSEIGKTVIPVLMAMTELGGQMHDAITKYKNSIKMHQKSIQA